MMEQSRYSSIVTLSLSAPIENIVHTTVYLRVPEKLVAPDFYLVTNSSTIKTYDAPSFVQIHGHAQTIDATLLFAFN